MGWVIALAVVVILAILPLGVSVIYEESGTGVWVLAGPLRLRVYPVKKKEKSGKTKKQPVMQPQKGPAAAAAKKGGSWKDFQPLVRIGLDFLRDLRRRIRVKRLELNLCMAGDDPCDLAINYGRANAAMGVLLAGLNQTFNIKKQHIHIDCDFAADEMTIYARLDATVTLGRIILLLNRYGVRGLKTYLQLEKIRKGGASL